MLDENGLSFRHNIDNKENGIEVTCIIAHESGHSEQTSVLAPPDKSGSKNDIQAIGSSITYLKRYTLESICGIVTTDDDNDGNTYRGDIAYIKEDQIETLDELSQKVDRPRFFNWLKNKYHITGLDKVPAHLFETIKSTLEQSSKGDEDAK